MQGVLAQDYSANRAIHLGDYFVRFHYLLFQPYLNSLEFKKSRTAKKLFRASSEKE